MLVEVLEARDIITLIHEVNGSETYGAVNSMKQSAGELQLFVSVSLYNWTSHTLHCREVCY